MELEAEVRLPVDVQVLNEAPLSFKYRVVTEGRLLLSRDERLRKELVNTITREYLDFQCLCAFYGRRGQAGLAPRKQSRCSASALRYRRRPRSTPSRMPWSPRASGKGLRTWFRRLRMGEADKALTLASAAAMVLYALLFLARPL